MIVKLAAALNMSRQELEKELRNSTIGRVHGQIQACMTMLLYANFPPRIDDESGIAVKSLLSKNILSSYESTAVGAKMI